VHPSMSKSDQSRENRISVQVVEEIATPNTMRLLLRVQGANETSNGKPSSFHMESEVTRLVYKKMGIAKQKDWVVALPKAFIHVFGEEPR